MSDERATYRLDLQYDGSGFHGWSRQPGLLTVEGSLEVAFETLMGIVPKLAVAGRTDAGVHARKQVVSLALPRETDVARLSRGLNALTPESLLVRALTPAPAGFDARRQALSRSYRYFLRLGSPSPFDGRYAWNVREPLDLASMQAAAQAAVGLHDFRAFTPTETEHASFHRRVKRCLWRRRGQAFCLEVEAGSFLRHMVRILVGTLVDVGAGRRSLDDMVRMLEGAPREAAGATAPSNGLFLWDVCYADESAAIEVGLSGSTQLPSSP